GGFKGRLFAGHSPDGFRGRLFRRVGRDCHFVSAMLTYFPLNAISRLPLETEWALRQIESATHYNDGRPRRLSPANFLRRQGRWTKFAASGTTTYQENRIMADVPFDKRDGFIWFNGELVPWADTKIHVLTHGLHYASCVFEGCRMYGGEIFKLREHSERLIKSAEILGFTIPYSVEEIDEACNAAVRAQKLTNGYVRPVAW